MMLDQKRAFERGGAARYARDDALQQRIMNNICRPVAGSTCRLARVHWRY
jgi:hypothetical protein